MLRCRQLGISGLNGLLRFLTSTSSNCSRQSLQFNDCYAPISIPSRSEISQGGSDVGRQGFGIFVDAFKRGPSRFVFLPDEGMAFFLKLIEGRGLHDFVFVSDQGTKWTTQYKNQIKKAVLDADLPKEFVFHGLRHTYASQLVAAGGSLEVIAKQLGHANTTTVSQFYGHLAEHFRESEIRSHFAPISNLLETLSSKSTLKLKQIESIGDDDNFRKYAAVECRSSNPMKDSAVANAEVMKLFHDLEHR